MTVTHKPKGGALLTGTEYEAADSHVVAITHAETTGQTTDDHHAKSHVHLADGSGTVAHSSLSGITATDHHAAPAAGPDANVTVDAAGAAGTASTFARSGHGHQLVTSALAGTAVGTAAAGTSGTAPSRGDHVHSTGAGTPTTSAVGDAAATGAGPAAAMTNHVHGREAFGGVPAAIGTAAAGTATTVTHSDHVHATGAGTPSTSTPGDAAAVGTGPAASMTDHKHARATATRKLFLPAATAKLDVATAVNLGASANLLGAVAYADAATQGAFWTVEVPADWASGVITVQMVWSPGATDGVAHTVRWSMTCKTLAAGVTVTAAGTTVAFTGSSAARTIAVLVYDTATSTTLTPAAAGDLFMIEVQRIGADAADTYVGVVNLVGLIVSYTANT